MKYPNLRQTAVASLVALTLGMTACSSDDDDGDHAVDGAVDGAGDAVDGAVDGAGDAVDGADDLVDGGLEAPDADSIFDSTVGSFTVTLTNTSDSQPMTPPVVILHDAPEDNNGFLWFEVGQPAIGEVVMIAEDGLFMPLLEVAQSQGFVSAAGPAFVDPVAPGPVLPGQTATVTLDSAAEGQVMTIVTMVVCTNDGFTGVSARPLAEETVLAPIYDAGSESNVEMLDYWVPPCGGGDENIGDEENGAIAAHPGQANVLENEDFNFPAGSRFLEISVTRN